MEIPEEIIRYLNPSITNPMEHSVIYTPKTHTLIAPIPLEKENALFYIFPYSKDTFWTHFKVSTEDRRPIYCSIVIITEHGYEYEILKREEKQSGQWYNTVYPLPAINSEKSDEHHLPIGMYLRVHTQTRFQNIRIHMLGFTDLFPASSAYLLQKGSTPDFILHRYDHETEDGITVSKGIIYPYEDYSYVREMIKDKSIVLRPLIIC